MKKPIYRKEPLGNSRPFKTTWPLAMSAIFLILAGCSTVQDRLRLFGADTRAERFEQSKKYFAQGNYEAAFQENEKILSERTSDADVALFNMGLISAHSLNPDKDYQKALGFFRSVSEDYPESPLGEQAKVWTHVLEEYRRMLGEKDHWDKQKQTLMREKENIRREKEQLAQEREKLKYAVEKARQIDIDIEKRRRQARAK